MSRRPEHSARAGRLFLHRELASRHVPARNVAVWVPSGYEQGSERYPVVYAHDGQNLFEPQTSTLGIDWGLDEAMAALAAQGKAPPAILVGVWCIQERVREYQPVRPFRELVSPQFQARFAAKVGQPTSDQYLRFLLEELKPFVDSEYRTLPGREDTFVMGSSMGALVSAYAVCEFPDAFAGAGCVSTHWPALAGAMEEYLLERLPPPGRHRFYFDYGTRGVDEIYEPHQILADEVMRRRGYTAGRDWVTIKFEGHEHSERAWRERAPVVLDFLLAGRRLA